MKWILPFLCCGLLTIISGCDKETDDLVTPLSASEFPQVIHFDNEGDGDFEDADEFSFKLVLNDRPDPSGEKLDGTILPLTEDVVVFFEMKDLEGISHPENYIKSIKAFYEIDDCTNSDDAGIDLHPTFDASTGKGSVVFPKGIEEVEIVFETDEDLLNDEQLNSDTRSIGFQLTGLQTGAEKVTYNEAMEFTYEVLDDESVRGDWELDHEDEAELAAFKELFGPLDEAIAQLHSDEIDKIEISIEYNEVKIKVELKEKETVDGCDGPEEENKEIELEADLEELSTFTNEGDIEFAGEIEQSDKSVKEYIFKGGFKVNGENLQLELVREYDDEESGTITLKLKK